MTLPDTDPERRPPVDLPSLPPRTGWLRFDLIVALTAIIVSIVSLIVGIRSERTQRALLAAGSWPFPQISLNVLQHEASLKVENEGVGPALMMSFEISYDGSPVDSVVDLLRRCCGATFDIRTPEALQKLSFSYGQHRRQRAASG